MHPFSSPYLHIPIHNERTATANTIPITEAPNKNPPNVEAHTAQIGRASCRERV